MESLAEFAGTFLRRVRPGRTTSDGLSLHQFTKAATEDGFGHDGSVVEQRGGFNTKLFAALTTLREFPVAGIKVEALDAQSASGRR